VAQGILAAMAHVDVIVLHSADAVESCCHCPKVFTL
jgi:hypothetical protein